MPKHPVPVFPLPGVVLFPGAQLPLHVFELRYRTMVREALSGERVIALALLRPGWERDYQGSPEFHPLGCLARIDEVAWLPNDCYNLRLLGLARVRLGRLVREFPYRAARTQVLPQEPLSEDDPLVQLERHALIEAGARL
ncbi:MAG: LON peptidase substrate-binding domain-containing protein, partial [Candidatus Eisenbacteria bacterium]